MSYWFTLIAPPNCSPRNNVIVAHGVARRPLVPGPLNAYEAAWMIACFRCIRVPSKNRTAPNRTALPAWPTQLRRHSESHPFPSPQAPASSGLIMTARTPAAPGPGSTEGFCQQATEADAPPPLCPTHTTMIVQAHTVGKAGQRTHP